MNFAMWAYPWDLLDEGVESAADRLAEAGIDEVNLATNYHAVQTFLPRNPERRTFFARASSYFHPDESRYGDLSPVPNEAMGEEDWVEQVVEGLDTAGLDVNSWTIGCHNSRLGMANRDLTLTSPFGDSLVFGLCPSQPTVQAYLRGLVSDLSARGSFDRVELETFDYFYGTGFGWHHDKYNVELGRFGEFLFGLCFCDECRANARDAGIDVETAREAAREGVTAVTKVDVPPDASLTEWFRVNPSLRAYVERREETLTDLYADLEDAADGVELGRYLGLLDVESEWIHGADPTALADHLDYYTVIAYESDREAAVQRVRTADRLTPDVPLHAGVLPAYPAVEDAATTSAIVDGLAAAGTERVSFYNYGLLPERSLEWVRGATDPYR